MKTTFLITLALLLGNGLLAQQTVKLNGNPSPPATLADVAWITGNWTGKAFGGEIQEFWAPPMGDSMMCAFKLVVDGKVQFYELCQIREENGSLIIRLKHFNGDLTAWEEKEERVEFPLVKLEKDAAFFEDFTIRRISEDQINMYVLIGNEGDESEVEFKYYRQK